MLQIEKGATLIISLQLNKQVNQSVMYEEKIKTESEVFRWMGMDWLFDVRGLNWG